MYSQHHPDKLLIIRVYVEGNTYTNAHLMDTSYMSTSCAVLTESGQGEPKQQRHSKHAITLQNQSPIDLLMKIAVTLLF